MNQQADDKHDYRGRRCVNGRIGLRLPADVVEKRCALYQERGKPAGRPQMLYDDDFSIVARYQAEYRGVVQYYLLAQNVFWLGRLRWVMQTSLLKTLARKHQTSVVEEWRRYRTYTATPYGSRRCMEVVVERDGKKPLVARFGGIPLKRDNRAILVDAAPAMHVPHHNELIKRLLAEECELCGSWEGCEVHHVRKLADLKVRGRKEKPAWMRLMAARRRKTLVLCWSCHEDVHYGRPARRRVSEGVTGEPCAPKGASTVRRGADGKEP